MSNRNYVFKAKTVEAYTIKSLSEVLQNILTDVSFSFTKEGISLITVDNKQPPRLLVHLEMSGKSFDEYHCPNPQSIGINLQHLYKMLKSIKKKDTITLFIHKDRPRQLGIETIQTDTNQPVTSNIKIQHLPQVEADIPTGYGHPIHIPTSVYQKMCKDMQGISQKIEVYGKGNYLSFSCEEEGMFTRTVPFGELIDDTDLEDYRDVFYTKSLSQLIKVSGLNTRMQIYTPPHDSEYDDPLKIGIKTGQLGELNVFIKSVEQIDAAL